MFEHWAFSAARVCCIVPVSGGLVVCGLSVIVGYMLLGACWLSGLFWATFLFRLLGVWCHRSRAAALGKGATA